ncbi:helix-turn-helix domain-containing protein [Novosphingobium sediminis]
MQTFVKVAESGSFAEAARRLHMSPPAVTRAVSASAICRIQARMRSGSGKCGRWFWPNMNRNSCGAAG